MLQVNQTGVIRVTPSRSLRERQFALTRSGSLAPTERRSRAMHVEHPDFEQPADRESRPVTHVTINQYW
jgi:hypothetical protein